MESVSLSVSNKLISHASTRCQTLEMFINEPHLVISSDIQYGMLGLLLNDEFGKERCGRKIS